jgi:hypothetical protein
MPSTDTEKDKEKEREASIPPVLKMSERISHEQELKRVGKELETLGALSDYDKGSKKYNRHVELASRQTELRKILGVTA